MVVSVVFCAPFEVLTTPVVPLGNARVVVLVVVVAGPPDEPVVTVEVVPVVPVWTVGDAPAPIIARWMTGELITVPRPGAS